MASQSTPNPYRNSYKIKAAQKKQSGFGRNEAEFDKFTEGGALVTYPVCAGCNFDHYRTTISSDESDPTTASVFWDFKGYKGMVGHLQFNFSSGTPNADVVLWALDEQNQKMIKVGTASNVGHQEQFRFKDDVQGRMVILQITGITGSPTSVDVYASRN